jgi:hypothetical protein
LRHLKVLLCLLVALLASLALGTGRGVASPGETVLICATNPDSYDLDVQAKLMGTGRFDAVDIFDCGSGTPTPSDLASYSAVLAYPDSEFADPVALGNELADYADAGGHVVEATFGFDSGYTPLGGRWLTDGYSAFVGAAGQLDGDGPLSLVADDPSSPLLAGVSSFDGGDSSYRNIVAVAPDATLVAHWNDDASMPLAAIGPHSVGLNFYPPSTDARGDFWNAATDGATLLANALEVTQSGKTSSARIAVCTTKPVLRVGDGSFGSFAEIPVALWQASKDVTGSPFEGSTPALYVAGFGLVCSVSDVVTYGGNPSAFAAAGYNVDGSGAPAPAGTSDADAGAYYPYYSAK